MLFRSVSQSRYRVKRLGAETKLACFDSRVFQISDPIEVENYFIWRQSDAVRNSISAVAQSMYSSKQLDGVSCNQMQEMIFQKGVNWNAFDPSLKRGRFIERITYALDNNEQTIRSKWTTVECPSFTEKRDFLRTIQESFTINSIVLRLQNLFRIITGQITIQESIIKSYGTERSIDDSLTIN